MVGWARPASYNAAMHPGEDDSVSAALHRLIYVIVVLGTIHFWMAVKRDITLPLIFAVIFAVLLGYRVVMWRRRRARHVAPAPAARPSPSMRRGQPDAETSPLSS